MTDGGSVEEVVIRHFESLEPRSEGLKVTFAANFLTDY
jgi:hypothetical protein